MHAVACSAACTMPAPSEPLVVHCKHPDSTLHVPAAGMCCTLPNADTDPSKLLECITTSTHVYGASTF